MKTTSSSNNSTTTTTTIVLLVLLGSASCLDVQGLPAPRNFRVTSVDLNCFAEWSPDPSATRDVTYRLQYKSYWIKDDNKWKNISCPDARRSECDFTASCQPSSNHTLRVRAEAPGAASEWAHACCFQPLLSTRLTAPSTSVIVSGLKFYVKVENLKVRNGSDFLENVYSDRQWFLNYTEEANGHVQERFLVTQNHHKFTVPHAGNYCLRSQFYIPDFYLYGDQSAVACYIAHGTPPDSLNLPVVVTIALLSVLIVGPLAAMGWFYRQKLKTLVSPTDPPPPAILQRLEEESKTQHECNKLWLSKSRAWEGSSSHCIVEDDASNDDNCMQPRPLGNSGLQSGSECRMSVQPARDGSSSSPLSRYDAQVDATLQRATFTPVRRSTSDRSDCSPAESLMADVWPDNGQGADVPFYMPHQMHNLPCTEGSKSMVSTASSGLDFPYSCVDLSTVTGDFRQHSKSDDVLSVNLESRFAGGNLTRRNSKPDCSMYGSQIVILMEPASQCGTGYRKTWIVPKMSMNGGNLT
ncbi:uncharacterized protein LOC116951661 [Petromyzon marinus]|uniref:uncharacterized protein LOC116951661 n=1 Tax=Petromyzon marinus TaxID=7757 RepID=UPI003F717E65